MNCFVTGCDECDGFIYFPYSARSRSKQNIYNRHTRHNPSHNTFAGPYGCRSRFRGSSTNSQRQVQNSCFSHEHSTPAKPDDQTSNVGLSLRVGRSGKPQGEGVVPGPPGVVLESARRLPSASGQKRRWLRNTAQNPPSLAAL